MVFGLVAMPEAMRWSCEPSAGSFMEGGSWPLVSHLRDTTYEEDSEIGFFCKDYGFGSDLLLYLCLCNEPKWM